MLTLLKNKLLLGGVGAVIAALLTIFAPELLTSICGSP